jgi:hypothetical protein
MIARKKDQYRAFQLETVAPELEQMLQEVVWRIVSPPDIDSTTEDKAAKAGYRVDFNEKTLQALAEETHTFALLCRITADCRERNKLLLAYQLAVCVYEFACLVQLGCYFTDKPEEETGSELDRLKRSRFHKGHLLHQISQITYALGWHWHTDYYLTLTLAEDILSNFVCLDQALIAPKSDVSADPRYDQIKYSWHAHTGTTRSFDDAFDTFWTRTGVCEWLRNNHGFKKESMKNIVLNARTSKELKDDSEFDAALLFPEWAAGVFDLFKGKYRPPVPEEIRRNAFNSVYWAALSHRLMSGNKQAGEKNTGLRHKNEKGGVFEEACRYLCSTVPGIRVRREPEGGDVGQVDLIGFVDSQSRFVYDVIGPDFVAECKWRTEVPGVQDALVAGARTQQVRCRTFLYFSKTGLSGTTKEENAHADLQLQLLAGQFGIIGVNLNSKTLKIDVADSTLRSLLNRGSACLNDIAQIPQVPFPDVLRDEYEKAKFRIYRRRSLPSEINDSQPIAIKHDSYTIHGVEDSPIVDTETPAKSETSKKPKQRKTTSGK